MTADRPALVPEKSTARVTITGPLRHLCPHVTEVDDGSVEVSWICAGQTLELHALAAYLESFADERVSHEELTRQLRDELAGLQGIADVRVVTRWSTAGLAVRVER